MEHQSSTIIFKDEQGTTYFHERILTLIEEKSPIEEIIATLENVDVSKLIDSFGNVLLHIAAQYNNDQIIQYLIISGCPIDVQNNLGKTPLIIAIENQCKMSVKILLEANANLFIRDNSDKNALYWLLDSQWLYELWYLSRITIRSLEHQFFHSKMIASRLLDIGWSLPYIVILRNVEVTKIMLNLGCKVDVREARDGLTALHVAVMLLDVDHVKFLLDNNADANAKDNIKRTPLSMICDPWNGRGETEEQAEIVKLLIDRGAALITSDGTSNRSQVESALTFGGRKVIEILLQANLDFNRKDEDGRAPIHILASNKKPDVFMALVRQGHNFDVNLRNAFAETPLSIAAAHGNISTVKFLLDNGADIDALTVDGYSPLRRCVDSYRGASSDHEEIIQLLLEHGADIYTHKSHSDQLTVFDVDHINKAHAVGEFVVAQVAFQVASGVSMVEYILQKIRQNSVYKYYYELFKQRLNIRVYKKVKLIDLLRVNSRTFERYARDQEMESSIARFNKKYNVQLRYFTAILQKRYSTAAELLKLRYQAARNICEIMEIGYSGHRLIGDGIVDYLDKHDLQNFLQASS